MGAKKKRTQLKPVNRGFATTSVPKKVNPEEEALTSAQDNISATDAAGEQVTGDDIIDRTTSNALLISQDDEFDPAKVAEQEAQNLLEKLQDKTDKEINRTLKTVEFDKRLAKTFSKVEIDTVLRKRILDLVEESQRVDPEAPLTRSLLDEPEEKLLARMGITYGVLRRLGFSETRVQQCLQAMRGVDLDEAYDWLYLHCDEVELSLSRDQESSNASSKAPRTPRTPHSGHNLTLTTPSTPLSATLPPPSSKPTTAASLITNQISSRPAELDDDDNDTSGRTTPEDPNIEYAQIKLKINERSKASGGLGSTSRLQKRLEELQGHYFFKQSEANAHFKQMEKEARVMALEESLRNVPSEKPSNAAPILSLKTPRAKEKSPSVLDVAGDGEETLLGNLMDEMPTSEVTPSGVLVTVIDMELPKHWAGRTPKTLLQETVHKIDRYAITTYRNLSGQSRVKRFGVVIRWEGARMQEWTMEDVGCPDERQAEQYIATVALHALTFPPQDGFAGSTTSSTLTYFRLLPPIFRDLWDRLEVKRKELEDTINRQIWVSLREVLQPKLSTDEKVSLKTNKTVLPVTKQPISSAPREISAALSEQLMLGFQARQNSPAYQDMLVQRNTLPIAAYRQEILTTLAYSQVMVLSGETGCGKSTQLPSFILEDQLSRGKPCKIFCTEPRRISAISLAQRVSKELGDAPGAVGTNASLVGYSIRLESNTSRNTRLTFCTNGIALRMLEGGSGQGGKGTAFDEITHIVIDEVHERSIESDFLLIVLKSLLEQRGDLKVILMSATVDAEKISQFFGGCPMLHVPGRTFPVDVRYLEDAVEYTKWSIKDNSPYAKRFNDKFSRSGKQGRLEIVDDSVSGDEDDGDSMNANQPLKVEKRLSASTIDTINLLDERQIPYDLIIRLLEKICFGDPSSQVFSAAVLIFMPGINEIRRLNDDLVDHQLFGDKDSFVIYPLHSTISSESQGAAFDIPPPGVRKIVIATNIAETGITIPDVTCVIDSGKHREMRFDEKRQISRLVESYIARSNAAQRRGRAGRVQNGLCFHLFTKQRHDSMMADHPLPEMLRLSLSDLALRIKILKVNLGNSIEDVLSRALDPPASVNVQRAVSSLVEVKALTLSEEITPMGRLLSKLPTDVHLGKFLLNAVVLQCLDPALTIAATLNAKSPFITPFGAEEEADKAKNGFKVENSDFLTIHAAFASWRRASNNGNTNFIRTFCRKNYLSHQNLQQIEELRQQFLGYLIDAGFLVVGKDFQKELSKLRWSRGKTKFVTVPPEYDVHSNDNGMINIALGAGLYPKVLVIDPQSHQMRTLMNNQPAAFHPSSVNFRARTSDFGANHLCYFTIMQSKKLYAWETGPLDELAILLLCGDAEFKTISDSVLVDRKIKFQFAPKTVVALKYLREQVASIMATWMRSKPLSAEQEKWNELAMMVLRKVKVVET